MKTPVTVALVLIVGTAAFWGGTLYRQQQIFSARRGFTGYAGQDGFGGGRGFGGPGGGGRGEFRPGPGGQGPGGAAVISGRLDKVTEDELTLTTRFGAVKIKLDSKTKIKRAVAGSAADLKIKKDLIIEGQRDEAGSVTAATVVQ